MTSSKNHVLKSTIMIFDNCIKTNTLLKNLYVIQFFLGYFIFVYTSAIFLLFAFLTVLVSLLSSLVWLMAVLYHRLLYDVHYLMNFIDSIFVSFSLFLWILYKKKKKRWWLFLLGKPLTLSNSTLTERTNMINYYFS